MSDNYKRTNVKEDTIEFTITIPAENFSDSYEAVAKDHAKQSDMKGFRKGQVPVDIIEKNLGDTIKYEAFEKLAPLYVNTVLVKEKIEPIAPPMYKDFPKLEKGNDVVFTIVVTVMPEFKLGNLKKIKIEKKEAKVTEKEITEALENLQKEQKTKEKEINDEWAKEISKMLNLENIKELKDLKKLIKDSLRAQKEHIILHENQDKALEEAVKISKIKIPEEAVKYEALERERTFAEEMKQRGVDIKDFMKMQNLTIEKMREMWSKDAREALETDVLLKIFAKENGIDITDEELEKKIEEIKRGQGGKEDDVYSNPQWREYIRSIEKKQKAFMKLMEEILGEDGKHKD